MKFKNFETKDFQSNPFDLIGKEWMLVTAGKLGNYNTMTASWGGVGYIWEKPVAMAVVRQSRYTLEFMEKNNYFTFSFFPESYKEALLLCGSKSGRDTDKAKEASITPLSVPGVEAVAFSEANRVLVMRKVLHQDLTAQAFIDKTLFEENYADGDIHRLFIGIIEQVSE